MRVKRYIPRIFLVGLVVFVINKFIVRPWVLSSTSANSIHIFVLSLPNFIEAVFGALVITYLLFWIQTKKQFLHRLKASVVYCFSSVLAGIYVVSQEFKLHHLGGHNVFDVYDVVASILGLFFYLFIVFVFGYKPEQT